MASTPNDFGQVLHTFFCRALYDYQSHDLSSLSFRRGDIIEVLTQLESGWWDGLLNEERGWFPSNYVVQITDQEAAAELLRSGNLMPRAAASDPENEWIADEADFRPSNGQEPDLTPNGLNNSATDLWVPEVTPDGQIYYVNNLTGETSRDLPAEPDFDAVTRQSPNKQSQHISVQRIRSESSISQSNGSMLEPAGFGIQRSFNPSSNGSITWIQRLADDGLSYYYVHSITGETSWTPPSPALNDTTTRLRTDSNSTYDTNRLSVYSDNSDIHPLATSSSKSKLSGKISRAASQDHLTSAPNGINGKATTDAQQAARDLQKALQPPPVAAFLDDVIAVRGAISSILEIVPNPDILAARVDKIVLMLRQLLYRSGTLVAGIKLTADPAMPEDAITNRLKPLQRKVTATLSKVVLSARASRFSPDFGASSLGRTQQDARDLDRTVVKFVEEVEKLNLKHLPTKRLTGSLLSGDGAAGVGSGNVGAGVGGGWKGLGYVPLDEGGPSRRLGTSLITEFEDQKAILIEKATTLASTFMDAMPNMEVRNASRDFLSRLFIFTNTLADTNVAQHVHVDEIHSPDRSFSNSEAYAKSIHRARELVRRLEVTTQALYDAGATFILAAQSPYDLAETMQTVISTLELHIANAVELINDLYAVGHEQAALADGDKSEFGYSRNDTWPPSSSGTINPFDGTIYPPLDHNYPEVPPKDELDELVHPGANEEDVVDMEAAFSIAPRPLNGSTVLKQQGSYTSSAPSNFSEFALNELASESVTSIAPSSTTTAFDTSSLTTITKTQVDPEAAPELASELQDDEDLGVIVPLKSKTSKGTSKADKIAQLLGADAPTRIIKAEAKPWYLKADYPPQDIMLNPDGSVRAGTLMALVEHLTDHDYRDANYIRTFLLTFKSFSTIDDIFDLLVKRFHTEVPKGLTEAQFEEWRVQKKEVFQIRVLNIMKQIITEEDVLDQDDTGVLSKMRDFAISVQDISPPAKLLVRVTERALNGEDAIVKTLTKSVNSAPPPSLLPRVSKKLKLLDIDPTELGRQLTIMDAILYNRIRVMECLMRAKEQKSKNADRDNISAIIERTNQLAAWINQQILEKDDSRKRAQVIKYFISVADRCRSMNNFSTMAALTSGLNTPPIRRLKRTWEQVGNRSMTLLQVCEKTFDSNKNFNNYRTTLARIQPPCVPFLGVYLTTLVFINEGSKDILTPPPAQAPMTGQPIPSPPSGPLINFAKRQKAAEVIREIKNWQTKPYNLLTVPMIQSFIDDSLGQLGKVDEMSDHFWNRSLELEPREREDEKMARLLQESGFL